MGKWKRDDEEEDSAHSISQSMFEEKENTFHSSSKRNDHLFEVIIDARLEVMNERPGITESERTYFLTAHAFQDITSKIS